VCGGVGLIYIAQDKSHYRAAVNVVMNVPFS
jgi:hypothetical protein